MPPNTNSSNPPPSPLSSQPSVSQPSQPSIRTFFNRTGNAVRESLSNALEIDTDQDISIIDIVNEGEENGAQMDTSESRKRSRPEDDSILGVDATSPPVSQSMIGNTSITEEGDTRRRRLSSSDIPSFSGDGMTSTPTIIQQQMVQIRNNAAEVSDVAQVIVHHATDHEDYSEMSDSLNIQTMVGWVVALTTDDANYSPERHNTMTWDDSDMNLPTLPILSPRPLPNIQESEEELSPAPSTSQGANSSDTMSAIREMIRSQMEMACRTIETTIVAKLSETTDQVAKNSQDIGNANERIVSIEEEWQRQEVRVDERMDIFELRQDGTATIIGENVANIDRIDRAMSNLARNQNNGISNEVVQALISRIESLEQAQHQQTLTEQEIARYREDKQRQDDDYFLRTISLRGFIPPTDIANRYAARKILAAISCEDILATVTKFSFSQDRKRLRLTFSDKKTVHDTTHWMAEAIREIKGNGADPHIMFSVLTPPRFSKEREILNKIGTDLKKKREISRYTFLVRENQLVLRVSAPGKHDRMIKCPSLPQNDDNMEVDNGEEDSSCPICMATFDDQKKIIIFHCGHVFHEDCMLASLSQSMKCPFCRLIPPTAALTNINCTRCKKYIEDDEDDDISADNMVMAMKCHHMHLSWCQSAHLTTIDTEYPPTPEGLVRIRNDNVKGCYSCNNDIQDTPRQTDIMHQVRFTPGMPTFVELGDNTPDNVIFPPLPTVPPPVLSGANSVPISQAPRSMNRPRSPPPPRPDERRHDRRDRSPLGQGTREGRQERLRGERRN